MVTKKFLKYLFMLSIVLSISCSSDRLNRPEPDRLLSRRQMAEVLGDIQLSEAAVSQKGYPTDSADIVNAGFEKFIFDKHHVAADDFINSYGYYLAEPDQMDSIYTDVLEMLSTRESELRAMQLQLKPVAPAMTDSAVSVQAPPAGAATRPHAVSK